MPIGSFLITPLVTSTCRPANDTVIILLLLARWILKLFARPISQLHSYIVPLDGLETAYHVRNSAELEIGYYLTLSRAQLTLWDPNPCITAGDTR